MAVETYALDHQLKADTGVELRVIKEKVKVAKGMANIGHRRNKSMVQLVAQLIVDLHTRMGVLPPHRTVQ